MKELADWLTRGTSLEAGGKLPYLGSGSIAGIEALARLAAAGVEIGFDPGAMGGGDDPFADYFGKVEAAGVDQANKFLRWADEQSQKGVRTVKCEGVDLPLSDYRERLRVIRNQNQQSGLRPHGTTHDNEHWLKRDSRSSLGLMRFHEIEAQVVAEQDHKRRVYEEIEAEKLAKGRERVQQEASMQQAEKRLSVLTPVLEEIKHFSNQTGIYPLGPFGFSEYDGNAENARLVTRPRPQLIQLADITEDRDRDRAILILKYGYRGILPIYEQYDDPDHVTGPSWVRDEEVGLLYGIKLSVEAGSSIIKLMRQTEELVPAVKAGWFGYARSIAWHESQREYHRLSTHWVPLTGGEDVIRRQLADAFHNPVYLGIDPLLPSDSEQTFQPTESQTNDSFLSFMKGLLGLK